MWRRISREALPLVRLGGGVGPSLVKRPQSPSVPPHIVRQSRAFMLEGDAPESSLVRRHNTTREARMVSVALDWKHLDWMPPETWKKVTLPKLAAIGLDERDLARSVYVIRLNGDFCVQYPTGQSPTLYIGEGRFNQRINAHRTWVAELKELVGDFTFQVCIAVPRVRNSANAYRDCEAAVIDRFAFHFGSAPMWNKQFEKRRNAYEYNPKQIDRAICKRSGAKYKWAVAPMRSSMFYRNFVRTHV